MEQGTTLYFTHSDQYAYKNQALRIFDILIDNQYELTQRTSSKPKNSILFKTSRADYSYEHCLSVNEIPEVGVETISMQFLHRKGHPYLINMSYNHDCRESNSSKKKIYWRMSVDDIELDLNWAAEDTSFWEKVNRAPLYQYSEVLKLYNLVKKIYLGVGFDVAAGSHRAHHYGFEELENFNGYDGLLRFDRNGVNRLIAAYEEGREIRSDEIYGLGSKQVYPGIIEYDHPVPIVIREPVPEVKRGSQEIE